jgi:hypothetical protein
MKPEEIEIELERAEETFFPSEGDPRGGGSGLSGALSDSCAHQVELPSRRWLLQTIRRDYGVRGYPS